MKSAVSYMWDVTVYCFEVEHSKFYMPNFGDFSVLSPQGHALITVTSGGGGGLDTEAFT